MQGRLAIEQKSVSIFHVTMNEFVALKPIVVTACANFVERRHGQQFVGLGHAIQSTRGALFQQTDALGAGREREFDVRGAGMRFRSVNDASTQLLEIERRHGFANGQLLGEIVRDSNLVDADERIRGNDGTGREINALA